MSAETAIAQPLQKQANAAGQGWLGSAPFAFRTALRELRGGLAGFRVFLACLILGVGGIAAVGSVTAAIDQGLAAEGQTILGGDVSASLAYRFADDDERAWLEQQGAVSEVVSMRSLLRKDGETALTEVKGVDSAYPLYGEVSADQPGSLDDLIAFQDGVPGLVAERVLVQRLGLSPGDTVQIGGGTFIFRGTLTGEPDRASGGFAMGPRVLTSTEGLRAAGMLQPGVLFTASYRVRLPDGADFEQTKSGFDEAFPQSGVRWRDRGNAAPGIDRFVMRLGDFLTIVGIAALAVGGVGIGAAVRGYLTRKIPVIAAFRTLGATAGAVFMIYLVQVGLIAALGIILGLTLGGGLIALLGPVFAADLPVPAEFTIYTAPLAKAALYGALAALLFALWPLAWLRHVKPAELFRNAVDPQRIWPGWTIFLVLLGLTAALVLSIVGLSSSTKLAAWCLAAIAGAFVILRALGWVAARFARRLSHTALAQRRPGLRLALGAVGAPASGTPGVVLALGLGLGVLAAIAQIDANMQRLLQDQLPEDAPAFFFVDIQSYQLDQFREDVMTTDGTERLETAPMLRGILTHLNGVPAAEAEIDPAASWVLRGDRGVSYSAEIPPGIVVTEGAWWDSDYSGPPKVSFAEEEGKELGLEIGSTITVNILGRPITAEVASFRKVEWRGMGINFLMILSPGALAGAPHTHIATLYADPSSEAPVMRKVSQAMPNVTPVLVRDQIDTVSESLGKLGTATRWGALAVLLTGLTVLIGTAAAGEERRKTEAAILKVMGASRGRIIASFALRAAMTGAIAGVVALFWGSLSAWGVMNFVFETPFLLPIGSTLAIILGGALISLLAGLGFALGSLRSKPARVLRTAAG